MKCIHWFIGFYLKWLLCIIYIFCFYIPIEKLYSRIFFLNSRFLEYIVHIIFYIFYIFFNQPFFILLLYSYAYLCLLLSIYYFINRQLKIFFFLFRNGVILLFILYLLGWFITLLLVNWFLMYSLYKYLKMVMNQYYKYHKNYFSHGILFIIVFLLYHIYIFLLNRLLLNYFIKSYDLYKRYYTDSSIIIKEYQWNEIFKTMFVFLILIIIFNFIFYFCYIYNISFDYYIVYFFCFITKSSLPLGVSYKQILFEWYILPFINVFFIKPLLTLFHLLGIRRITIVCMCLFCLLVL